jgi:hypothetical protein
VEIQDREQLAVHQDVACVVDDFLQGRPLRPEIRKRSPDGQVEIHKERPSAPSSSPAPAPQAAQPLSFELPIHREVRIFTYGVNRDRLEKVLRKLKIPAQVIKDVQEADLILSHKGHQRRQPKRLRDLQSGGVPLYVVKSNTIPQIEMVVHKIFGRQDQEPEDEALLEAEQAVQTVITTGRLKELGAQNAAIRAMQHQIVHRYGLQSESRGQEPHRQVVILPW